MANYPTFPTLFSFSEKDNYIQGETIVLDIIYNINDNYSDYKNKVAIVLSNDTNNGKNKLLFTNSINKLEIVHNFPKYLCLIDNEKYRVIPITKYNLRNYLNIYNEVLEFFTNNSIL